MDKSYFLELADYNIWANEITHTWLKDISEDQWSTPIVSSFGNIEATALHISAAESIWLERLQQVKSPVWLPQVINPNRNETLSIWMTASQNLKSFVADLDESNLKRAISFIRKNGEADTMKIHHMLAHVFNHSTYHRGQLVTMLRQVGYEAVSGTDMIVFFRKNN